MYVERNEQGVVVALYGRQQQEDQEKVSEELAKEWMELLYS